MIKFKADTDKGPLLGFGITRANVARLMADQPIRIDLSDMGLEGHVVIFYGTDERGVFDAFVEAGFIDEDTRINLEK